PNRAPRTDLGEMASLSAAEALTACVGERLGGLFPTGEEVHRTVSEFSTRNGFAALAHEFFARFTKRFLLYHLGRELSQHDGANGRFGHQAAYSHFITDLEVHCRETALIVWQYSGDWYDKARFERGITEQQARNFSAYSLRRKLAPELAIRGRRD